MKNLQKLQKLVASVGREDITNLTRDELEEAISQIIDFLADVNKKNRDEFSQVSGKLGQDLMGIRQALKADVDRYKNDLSEAAGIRIIESFRQRLESIEDRIQARLAELKDGKDGISPAMEDVIKEMMPYIPKASTDTAEIIRNKLENLQGDERLDADAIKGLDEKLKKNVAKGGGPHALSQLIDVDVSAAADGNALSYDGTLKRWKPSTAGAGDVVKVGTPVDGQVGVWTGDGTIEGDSALTFDTSDDSLIIAASGNLKFGAVAVIDDNAGTTTLSNIDAIDATTTTTISTAIGAGNVSKVGTPANNQVGVWTGDGTLEGDAALTFDTTGDKLSTTTSGVVETGSIELGHATDTTLTRVSAGIAAIEGKNIALNGTGETLTTGTIELGAASDTTISRASAGVIAVEGKNVALNGTGETLTTGSIELGAASDTTITRASAGVIAVEGNNVLTTATGLPLSGGTMTGNITLGENASIALDPAGSADGKYTGITITGTAGADLAFGDLIHLDPTDSRWELADANSASGADGDARGILGICVNDPSGDGQPVTVLLHGVVRADTAFPTLTINGPVYVSETAGDITQTKPTTTDNVIRSLGYAITADEIYFNPSPDYITHV